MKMVLMASIVFFGLSINAQSDQPATTQDHKMEKRDKKSPEERAKIVTEKMTKKLNLNEQQASKIYSLTLNEAKERDAIMSKNREARLLKHEAKDKEMHSILTPEQYTQYQKMKEDRKGKRKGLRKGQRNGNRNFKKDKMNKQ